MFKKGQVLVNYAPRGVAVAEEEPVRFSTGVTMYGFVQYPCTTVDSEGVGYEHDTQTRDVRS
jgi:hypothetical protein